MKKQIENIIRRKFQGSLKPDVKKLLDSRLEFLGSTLWIEQLAKEILMTVEDKRNELDGPLCPLSGKDCTKGRCELWLDSVYTTEGRTAPGRCSMKFAGEKNSEGLLPV